MHTHVDAVYNNAVGDAVSVGQIRHVAALTGPFKVVRDALDDAYVYGLHDIGCRQEQLVADINNNR